MTLMTTGADEHRRNEADGPLVWCLGLVKLGGGFRLVRGPGPVDQRQRRASTWEEDLVDAGGRWPVSRGAASQRWRANAVQGKVQKDKNHAREEIGGPIKREAPAYR